MTKTKYRDYMKSEHWQAKRKEAFEFYGEFCNRCDIPRWLAEIGYDQDLNIHHLSYARVGKEDMGDLEVICRRCHEIESHGRTEIREIKAATCEQCFAKHWDYRSSCCDKCQEMNSYPALTLERLQRVGPDGKRFSMLAVEDMISRLMFTIKADPNLIKVELTKLVFELTDKAHKRFLEMGPSRFEEIPF